jgi:hypothetical protein
MKYPLLLLTFFTLLFLGGATMAQAPHAKATDTAKAEAGAGKAEAGAAKAAADTAKAGAGGSATYVDDGFDPGIFFVLLVFAGIVAGAAIIGSIAAALILLALFLIASAGVVSAGVLVGFYRRSVTAGFKTVLYIACALGGIVLGVGGFYLVNHFFHLHFSYKNILLAGAGGGLVSGLLIALIVFQLIKLLFRYFRERLAI